MKKGLGVILVIVGLFGIAILFEPVKTFLNLPLAQYGITDRILTITSIACVVLGGLMLRGGGRILGRSNEEVPIYSGKEIIGYRRH